MMSKVNLVNAYFDGDLSESQVHDFENQLKNDPELKQEYDFQNDIVNGLKEARRLELKAMLNNTTVGGANVAGSGLGFGKIAASILFLGLVGSGVAWYLSGSGESIEEIEQSTKIVEDIEPQIEEEPTVVVEEQLDSENKQTEQLIKIEEEEPADIRSNAASNVNKAEEVAIEEEPVVITKPDIKTPDVITSFDNEESEENEIISPESGLGTEAKNEMPTIEVDIDNTKKKYTFHYQLKDGRLILYGSFDKGLYEILEFNTPRGKNVFLYYKDEYFALSENKEKVTPLVAVKDKELIQKLIKARGDS